MLSDLNAEPANTNAMIIDLIPALRAFARTLCRNPTDADDLVQETLVRAINSLHQYEQGTRLKSWLFTIMRNTFITSARKYARERPGSDGCVSQLGSTPPGQDWSRALHEVEEAMQRLPQKQREIVVLVAILGVSYDEAASICGCAIGTIKSSLNRARASLLADLGQRDLDRLLH